MARRLAIVPGVALVAFAAAMWGTDALFRRPLAHSTSAATIVFGEHVLLVALTLPLLVPALRALLRAGPRYVLAAVAVGAGASAVATILFTQAFVHGDPITPVVLQKVQPLVAIVGARIVLGEQPRRRFAWFLLPALAGVWLIALPHPLDVHARGLEPIAEALGAAVLWALGTVFGRYLARRISFEQIATLRFAFGLVASAAALPILGASAYAGAHDSLWIADARVAGGACLSGDCRDRRLRGVRRASALDAVARRARHRRRRQPAAGAAPHDAREGACGRRAPRPRLGLELL